MTMPASGRVFGARRRLQDAVHAREGMAVDLSRKDDRFGPRPVVSDIAARDEEGKDAVPDGIYSRGYDKHHTQLHPALRAASLAAAQTQPFVRLEQ